ncbi:MAG: peptidylprolyl isomerase [Chloroflexi bacterium]|nr:peptidylprolyl isomerase [Chloroflexota bacterium]
MKRIFSGFLLGMALLFTACSAEEENPPTPTALPLAAVPTSPPQFSCTIISALPTPLPDTQSIVPPITEVDFVIGPADAPVTIVEYCDFQSQGCLLMAQTIAELMRTYKGKIRFVFRPTPLTGILDKSDASALAAFAANEQGKFWEMYDLLFVNYQDWVNLSPGEFKSWVLREAEKTGMDREQLSAALEADEAAARLTSAQEAVKQLSIPAVPVVLINGALQQSYVLDYRSMSDSVGLILLGEKQFTECPPFTINPSKQYMATIETEKGNIVLQLFPDKAPLAVNSFVFLARQGWFDGVTFHRVIPGFAAQAGDPSGTGRGNPGYIFDNEISDLLFTRPGMVGMANSGPDTNGSQFFITFAPAAHLNGYYTIFGQVISGLNVAEQLTPRDPEQAVFLPAGDVILRITIEEK